MKLVTGRIGSIDLSLTSLDQSVPDVCGSATFTLTPSYSPEIDVQLQMEYVKRPELCQRPGRSVGVNQWRDAADVHHTQIQHWTL